MKGIKKLFRHTYFVILAAFFFITNVSAYIDPSTTAMVTQIVAGALISLGLVFGIFRQKIILFFKNAKVKRLQKKIERENSAKPESTTAETEPEKEKQVVS
ncbi:MAG: hypothetical protein FWG83_01225 [Oscillospiraceae bacterium]|nr:hypothetical protein [Oscillospiraceae bacterium]